MLTQRANTRRSLRNSNLNQLKQTHQDRSRRIFRHRRNDPSLSRSSDNPWNQLETWKRPRSMIARTDHVDPYGSCHVACYKNDKAWYVSHRIFTSTITMSSEGEDFNEDNTFGLPQNQKRRRIQRACDICRRKKSVSVSMGSLATDLNCVIVSSMYANRRPLLDISSLIFCQATEPKCPEIVVWTV